MTAYQRKAEGGPAAEREPGFRRIRGAGLRRLSVPPRSLRRKTLRSERSVPSVPSG